MLMKQECPIHISSPSQKKNERKSNFTLVSACNIKLKNPNEGIQRVNKFKQGNILG